MLLPHFLLATLALVLTQVASEDGTASTASMTSEGLSRADQLRSRRLIEGPHGRNSLGGCENDELRRIVQHVVGPLHSVSHLRLGDIAQILQQSVQRATGKSFEVMMGKGEMLTASSQRNVTARCRMLIGDYHTTIYETPVQYNINNVAQEMIMSNIDFGEPLGGSGYPGQKPFPRSVKISNVKTRASEPLSSSEESPTIDSVPAGPVSFSQLTEPPESNSDFTDESSDGKTTTGGSASPGLCDNVELSQIMQQVAGPLLSSSNQMKLGDIAKILQQSVQRATGKSFEIQMGKGEMVTASQQKDGTGSCRLKIGDYHTTVYETPVQYDIKNVAQETIMSNIDFGEPLGGSGYPGQVPFPRYPQISSVNSIVPEQAPPFRITQSANEMLVSEITNAPQQLSTQMPLEQEPLENEMVAPQPVPPAQIPLIPAGRTSLSGCGNTQLAQIMQQVAGPPLSSPNRPKLGDIAKTLQQSVQRATGKSHEVLIGKGEMVISSQQIDPTAVCRVRIREYDVTVYETPNRYNVYDVEQEKFFGNVDFGEPLGGSGYPGQWPWPHWFINDLLHGIFPRKECFSGDLLVETLEGPKRMSELQTGDEVLSIDETLVMFSPIIMFLHRDVDFLAEFIVITTAFGDTVKLTNEHLIYVFECDVMSSFRLMRAKEVTTYHCLFVVRSEERLQTTVRISNVTKTHERGIYAPLTATGDIIVNDVVTSCHSNLALSTLQNSFFATYRAAYRFFSFLLPEEGGKIPPGLIYFTTVLDYFIPVTGV